MTSNDGKPVVTRERSYEELRQRLEAEVESKALFTAEEMRSVLECIDVLDAELAAATECEMAARREARAKARFKRSPEPAQAEELDEANATIGELNAELCSWERESGCETPAALANMLRESLDTAVDGRNEQWERADRAEAQLVELREEATLWATIANERGGGDPDAPGSDWDQGHRQALENCARAVLMKLSAPPQQPAEVDVAAWAAKLAAESVALGDIETQAMAQQPAEVAKPRCSECGEPATCTQQKCDRHCDGGLKCSPLEADVDVAKPEAPASQRELSDRVARTYSALYRLVQDMSTDLHLARNTQLNAEDAWRLLRGKEVK
jgi:hypothetical protein